jgi:hypothetical protein
MASISIRPRTTRKFSIKKEAQKSTESFQPVSKQPVWLQNLPRITLEVACWEYLNALEGKVRAVLEGHEELKGAEEFKLVDGCLLIDKRQNRIGLRLHNRIPLSEHLGGYLHSLANYYHLSYGKKAFCKYILTLWWIESELTGKGKKRMVEGWIYLQPCSDFRKQRRKSDRRRPLPETLFCDIAPRIQAADRFDKVL